MKRTWRDRLHRELQIWRIGAIPGLLIIAVVLLVRLTGSLQNAEWFALDYLMRSRPAEAPDDRILVVGIDEADIRQMRTYPVPDRNLASLIQTLQQHQPTVIGLDIFRDLAVEPGHAQLESMLRSSQNIIGIERVLNADSAIAPPEALPAEQVGFADAILDPDGLLRRSLIVVETPTGEFKFSLTMRLAEQYLAAQGITPENGVRNPIAMRFNSTELSPSTANAGGYVKADAGGYQVLLNFRSGKQPFRIVSLQDVMSGNVPDDWIRDRIVLIGMTAASVKDVVNVAAINSSNPGLVNGVEVQAHAVSQIVSAVLDNRPLLNVWLDGWEYVWIVGWGILGISLGRMIRSPIKLLAALGIACFLLLGICYTLLLTGWWVPLVPAFLVLFLNGAGLTASLFYRYQQNLQTKLRDRQLVIEQTFDAIHNGPLQTLANMLRQADNPEQSDLKQLNQELRAVYESVRRELVQSDRFHLGDDQLDLNAPIHEVLYEIYLYTSSRDLPCFEAIKLNITAFELIDDRLTLGQKRGLCRFLEEALCNVGKHAIGATRLDVVCRQEHNQNIVRVIDDGVGIGTVDRASRGTQQAKALARQLGGRFRRSANAPQGTICELRWPIAKPGFWRF